MILAPGSLRSITAKETLNNLGKDLFKKYGITRVANITGLDVVGVPVFTAIRPNSKCLSVSQGKGLTYEDAKVSAIMESIETYCAENVYLHEGILVATVHSLVEEGRKYDLISKKDCGQEIQWLNCFDVIKRISTLIPIEYFSLNTTECSYGDADVQLTSNGLASGNTRDEAYCHSIFELLERDATHQWYIKSDNERENVRVALDSIQSTVIQNLLQTILLSGFEIILWDISTHSQLPVFYCVVIDENFSPVTVFAGQGCHIFTEIAICRAITEALQARLTYIAGIRDDLLPSFYKEYDTVALVNYLHEFSSDYQLVNWNSPNIKSTEDVLVKLDEIFEQFNISTLYSFYYSTEDCIAVVKTVCPDLAEPK